MQLLSQHLATDRDAALCCLWCTWAPPPARATPLPARATPLPCLQLLFGSEGSDCSPGYVHASLVPAVAARTKTAVVSRRTRAAALTGLQRNYRSRY
ncbi:unnamed protein product [Rangifer tarandus platyrhynchus]|uniref:Secreted protein n=1 Tax=Rangifer tarandus platyrhynchus TaxID=3082113 RepID=A0ABN8XJG2_RANTA|nr:unnamed protein product [Rangifer tarandus platyrhynchus]